VKDEYDFSGAERGKFFREASRLRLPLYLDDQVLKDLTERARINGVTVSELVQDLLKRSA
jgi:allophanate hydrolase subunit 1